MAVNVHSIHIDIYVFIPKDTVINDHIRYSHLLTLLGLGTPHDVIAIRRDRFNDRLFGAKPQPEPMLIYYQFGPKEQALNFSS